MVELHTERAGWIAAALCVGFLVVFFSIAFLKDYLVDEKSVLSTPTIPKEEGVFTAFASVKIKATASKVFSVLLKFDDYGLWNSQLPEFTWESTSADGAPFEGTKGKAMVCLPYSTSKVVKVKCTMINRDRECVAIRGGTSFPSWLLAAERVLEVVPVGGRNGTCEYREWVTYSGPLSFVVQSMSLTKIRLGVRQSAADLRKFVEGQNGS